jgi:hypothetical protein
MDGMQGCPGGTLEKFSVLVLNAGAEKIVDIDC